MNLPDVQNSVPKIRRPIRQVGVSGVDVPFKLKLRNGGYHDLVASVSMTTNLKDNVKGLSMSRFIRTLSEYLHCRLDRIYIEQILNQFLKDQDAFEAEIRFAFKMPMLRSSPITSHSFPIFHDCSFNGKICNEIFEFNQSVKVQYASYCPCSEELCEDLLTQGSRGFPHAQRSFALLTAKTANPYYVWLEDLIDVVTSSIATVPYPIIKREDEQEIARIAANNPIFVEDAIRQISEILDNKKEISDWMVKCVHEESIHTSEAIAIDWKGVQNGFKG